MTGGWRIAEIFFNKPEWQISSGDFNGIFPLQSKPPSLSNITISDLKGLGCSFEPPDNYLLKCDSELTAGFFISEGYLSGNSTMFPSESKLKRLIVWSSSPVGGGRSNTCKRMQIENEWKREEERLFTRGRMGILWLSADTRIDLEDREREVHTSFNISTCRKLENQLTVVWARPIVKSRMQSLCHVNLSHLCPPTLNHPSGTTGDPLPAPKRPETRPKTTCFPLSLS